MTGQARVDGDAMVRALVGTCRAAFANTGVEFRADASFQAVQQTLVASRSTRSARGIGIGAFAAAIVALGLWLRFPIERVLTYQVVNGSVGSDGHVVGSNAGTQIHFSDGSKVALSPDARTGVPEVTSHGGKLALTRGALSVNVRHLPDAAWSVNAGPYSVQVTGTAFDVAWSEREKVFDLVLHEGSVTVRGPLADSLKMVAGQRLLARIDAGTITLEDTTLPRLTRMHPLEHGASEAPSLPTAENVDPPSAAALPERASRAEAQPEQVDWNERLAQGDYRSVLADAERRGIARILAQGSLAELAVLSDASRYAQRGQLAQRTLLAIRQRFANSSRGREAAFFLGRLAEDQGSLPTALEWYDTYLAQGGNGVYVSQALGRKMLISHRQQGPAAARALAADYLTRFPKGAYAEAARKLQGL
jgi:hypothetical protein